MKVMVFRFYCNFVKYILEDVCIPNETIFNVPKCLNYRHRKHRKFDLHFDRRQYAYNWYIKYVTKTNVWNKNYTYIYLQSYCFDFKFLAPWIWTKVVESSNRKHKICRARKKVAKCVRSKFGCCPDRITPAAGPFDEGEFNFDLLKYYLLMYYIR